MAQQQLLFYCLLKIIILCKNQSSFNAYRDLCDLLCISSMHHWLLSLFPCAMVTGLLSLCTVGTLTPQASALAIPCVWNAPPTYVSKASHSFKFCLEVKCSLRPPVTTLVYPSNILNHFLIYYVYIFCWFPFQNIRSIRSEIFGYCIPQYIPCMYYSA